MVSGAILAGGRARRFDGRDKTQITIHGRTILQRQCAALRSFAHRVFLVGYHGDACIPETIERIADRIPGRGPLGGLDAALDAAGEPVLLVACDLPNLTSAFLEFLAGSLGSADAIVPRTERGYHPLCAVYAQSCRTVVRHRLMQGELRMTGLLAHLRLRVVESPECSRFGELNHLLANVNSQTDLDAIESLKNH